MKRISVIFIKCHHNKPVSEMNGAGGVNIDAGRMYDGFSFGGVDLMVRVVVIK